MPQRIEFWVEFIVADRKKKEGLAGVERKI